MKSVVRVADKGISFNQAILKFTNIIIQRLNSSGRGRSNKPHTLTADWDAITSNTFINIIFESDLQRHSLGVNNMGILEKMVSGGGRILDIIKPIIEYDIPTASNIVLQTRTEMITEGLDSNFTIILKNRASSSELRTYQRTLKAWLLIIIILRSHS